MQKTILRKATNEDINQIVIILKESNYSFNEININEFSLEKIKEFVKNNISSFTLYFINNELKGFSLAYSLENPIDRALFKRKPSLLKRLKSIFEKNNENAMSNDFFIEIIHFAKRADENKNIFIKFLEIERIKNNCSKIVF